MSQLVSISMARPGESGASARPEHRIRRLPVVVISPHNQCDCRCVMCDIWKIRDAKQITASDFERQLGSFHEFGVEWVVFSGGEPQKNSQLFVLAEALRRQKIRVTLLTAGMRLHSQAAEVAASVDDVIVSLDGPPAVHDRIRRVQGSFATLMSGVAALRNYRPDIPVRARCTIQKLNHDRIEAAVEEAKRHHLTSISFLAVDATSTAYNHPEGWAAGSHARVSLDEREIDTLESGIERLIAAQEEEERLGPRFVVETAEKLRRIVSHFRADIGQLPKASPRCNAPWVSAVIDAEGEVRPCFFHPALGNLHRQSLDDIVNSDAAMAFRSQLDVASNPVCQGCVCSLYIAPPQYEAGAANRAADRPYKGSNHAR